MKKIIIIFFISSQIAQAQITDKSNTYEVIDTTYILLSKANQQKLLISIIGIFKNDELMYYNYKVEVSNQNGESLQTFSDYYVDDIYAGEDDFILKDINFDNKDDLCVKTFENQFNASYEFWRYDTITYSFSYDSLLSSTVSFNPSFDNEKKEIWTAAGSPDWTYWEKTYRYNGHNLELIIEDYQEKLAPLPNDKYKFIYRRVKKTRQGDGMIIEKEVTGTIEEIGTGWDDR